MERLKKQMEFALELDKMKKIGRQTYLSDASRKENDAEHSWHMAVMVFLLAEYANEPIDVLKAVKMAMLHDIIEIYAGDTYAYDTAGNETKEAREQMAADRIYAMLPKEQGQEYRSLWEEFEAMNTPEARFVKALDNLQPLMLNDATNGKSWREHGVALSQVMNRQCKTAEGSVTLWNYARELIDKNVELGNIKDE